MQGIRKITLMTMLSQTTTMTQLLLVRSWGWVLVRSGGGAVGWVVGGNGGMVGTAGGANVQAGGVAVDAGGMKVTTNGLRVSAGGLTTSVRLGPCIHLWNAMATPVHV